MGEVNLGIHMNKANYEMLIAARQQNGSIAEKDPCLYKLFNFWLREKGMTSYGMV